MNKDLDKKIEMEEAKLKELRERRVELDQKIKKTENTLEKYKLLRNNNLYNELLEATEKTGLSLTDLFSALKNGDFLSLQERMEASQTIKEQEHMNAFHDEQGNME